MFRSILTYHPGIGTFRGTRGAWRVVDSYNAALPLEARPFVGLVLTEPNRTRPGVRYALFMVTTRRLHKGTFTDPTKLLREVLAERRKHYTSWTHPINPRREA